MLILWCIYFLYVWCDIQIYFSFLKVTLTLEYFTDHLLIIFDMEISANQVDLGDNIR